VFFYITILMPQFIQQWSKAVSLFATC